MICIANLNYDLDPVLKISEKVDDEYEYLKLTDDILKTIQFSECEELKKAREITKRLRTRKLYRFVDEFLIPAGMEQYLTKVRTVMLYLSRKSLSLITWCLGKDHITRTRKLSVG